MIIILKIIALVLQLIASGLSEGDAVKQVAEQFGVDPDEVKKYL